MLIGLGHRKCVGKDTAAGLLVAHHGFERVGFADKMREFLRAIDPIVSADPVRGVIRWTEMEERYGYDQAKVLSREFRDVMVRSGNDGRQVLGLDVWVRPVMAEADRHPRAVISDVRYPNEADAVKRAGGVLVRIVRPDVPDTHDVADDALDGYEGWDATIVNDGTVEELHTRLREALSLGVSCAG